MYFLPNMNFFVLIDIIYEIKIRSLVLEWNAGKSTINKAIVQNRDLTTESNFKIGFKYIISTYKTTAHTTVLFLLSSFLHVSSEYLLMKSSLSLSFSLN